MGVGDGGGGGGGGRGRSHHVLQSVTQEPEDGLSREFPHLVSELLPPKRKYVPLYWPYDSDKLVFSSSIF